jgi:minimal PKS acyl carrier protein
MSQFTLDDLTRVMRAAGGESEQFAQADDIDDMTFEELGYDSLAVIEFGAQIQQEFGVPVPDDAIEHMKTPALTVGYINQLLRQG